MSQRRHLVNGVPAGRRDSTRRQIGVKCLQRQINRASPFRTTDECLGKLTLPPTNDLYIHICTSSANVNSTAFALLSPTYDTPVDVCLERCHDSPQLAVSTSDVDPTSARQLATWCLLQRATSHQPKHLPTRDHFCRLPRDCALRQLAIRLTKRKTNNPSLSSTTSTT